MEVELRDRVYAVVDRSLSELAKLARYLYDNPELAYTEFKAQAILTDSLAAHGFKCELGVGGEPTAFIARPGQPKAGPIVAILAEYDALPEIGHGCGHNLGAAAAVGAGIAALEAAKEAPGQVVVVGTPAEEVPPSTKGAMLKAGVLDGVDVVLMMHPDDRTTAWAGSLAVSSFDFIFTGRPSHAAKYAHLGVSALDAAVLTFTALEFLREHVRDDVRLHGVITEGGTRPSVVPERAVIRYYVRAKERPYLNSVVERALDCARAGALATGASLEIAPLSELDDLLLVPELNRILEENAAAAGARQLMPASAQWGSNDLGDVSQDIPTAKLKTAFVPVECPNHTREWAEASVTPDGTQAIAVGAKAMAATALQLLSEPATLARVKEDFARQKVSAAARTAAFNPQGQGKEGA